MVDETMDEDLEEGAQQQDDEAAEDGSSKKKMSGKKLILFIALPALLVLGGGGYFALGMMGGGEEPVEEAVVEEEEHAPNPTFYGLPDMVVNLKSPGRKLHFLKISISLELGDAESIAHLEAVLPRIIDNFQVYLRELRIEDLRDSEGIYRLREELLRRVNIAAHPAKINDVLFKEMLVQ